MTIVLIYEFPEVIKSVVVVVQVPLQGAGHCNDRPAEQHTLLTFLTFSWAASIKVLDLRNPLM